MLLAKPKSIDMTLAKPHSMYMTLAKPKGIDMTLPKFRKGNTGAHVGTSEGSRALFACVEGCTAQDSQHWVCAEEGEDGSDVFISKVGTDCSMASFQRVMQAK